MKVTRKDFLKIVASATIASSSLAGCAHLNSSGTSVEDLISQGKNFINIKTEKGEDVYINYKKYGNKGPYIFIVPGVLGSLVTGEYMAQRLSERYQVVIWDPKGCGCSSWTPEDYHHSDIAYETINIMNVLAPDEERYLIGTSGGSNTARLVSIKDQKTRKFVFIAPYLPEITKINLNKSLVDLLSSNMFMNLIIKEFSGISKDIMMNAAKKGFYDKHHPAIGIIGSHFYDYIKNPEHWGIAHEICKDAYSDFESLTIDDIKKIDPNKVIVFLSYDDKIVEFNRKGESLFRESLPDLELVPVGGCGHFMHVERAEEISDEVDRFLSC